MHPVPADPVLVIPERDLPPRHITDPERVRIAITEMDKYSAPGLDRAGVRWLLLVAKNELQSSPYLSGLEILSLVVQKIAGGEFTTHVSHILSAASLLPLGIGADKLRPIAIGIVLRRLETLMLMLQRWKKPGNISTRFKMVVVSSAELTPQCTRREA